MMKMYKTNPLKNSLILQAKDAFKTRAIAILMMVTHKKLNLPLRQTKNPSKRRVFRSLPIKLLKKRRSN